MRERYRFDKDLGQVVQVFDHNQARKNSGPFFMPDIEQHYGAPIISPINGEHITSRSQLRAHERRYGVRQAGDFRPGELIGHQNRRLEANRKAAEGGKVTWN
jgi:hypothetical protein